MCILKHLNHFLTVRLWLYYVLLSLSTLEWLKYYDSSVLLKIIFKRFFFSVFCFAYFQVFQTESMFSIYLDIKFYLSSWIRNVEINYNNILPWVGAAPTT